jgi:PAS domain S-box-containing protein
MLGWLKRPGAPATRAIDPQGVSRSPLLGSRSQVHEEPSAADGGAAMSAARLATSHWTWVAAALEEDGLALALLRCRDRSIIGMNGVLPNLSGHSESLLLQHGLACLAGAVTDTAARDSLDAAIGAGTRLQSEICWSRADGTAFWFGFSVVPAGAIDELGAAVVLIGRDITDRRRASRQDAMTQAVLASVFRRLDVPAAVFRPDDRLLVANAAFAELTGYALPELNGMHIGRLISERSLAEARRSWLAQRRPGESCRMSLLVRRKDGAETVVKLTAAVIEQESAVGCRVVTLVPEGKPLNDIRMPRESVVGRVRLLQLEPLKKAYGERWANVAPRLMMLSETVIKRRLDPNDVFARTEDGGFAIWFARGSETENADRIAAMTREIRVKLLGEFEGDTAPDVTGLVATVPTDDLSHPPQPAELTAALMDRLEARRGALRVQVLGELQQALASPEILQERLAAGGGAGTGLVWIDLAAALRRRLDGARALVEEGDASVPDPEFVLLAAVAEQALSALAGGRRSPHLFPVSFGALAETARRRRFVASCRALPQPVREVVTPVLDGIPAAIHPTRLLQLGQELAPLFAAVGLAAEAPSLPQMLPGVGPFSLLVFEPGALKGVPDSNLGKLFGEARARRLKVAVRRADAESGRLARLGVQFLGSTPR